MRFSRLVKALKNSVTVLPATVACEIARTADAYLGNSAYILHAGDADVFGEQPWAADVAWAFGIGSSSVKKGRLLYTTIRFMRPSICVEAGSFFGISAFYILSALNRYSKQGQLHTIEVSEHQGAIVLSDLSLLVKGQRPRNLANPDTMRDFSWTNARRSPSTDDLDRLASKTGPAVTDLEGLRDARRTVATDNELLAMVATASLTSGNYSEAIVSLRELSESSDAQIATRAKRSIGMVIVWALGPSARRISTL